jgi:hypothetical protein
MLRLATIISLFFLSASMAFAGSDTTGFIHFSINNGFPTNNVYSLLQDKNGFLWFATDNGIVKYNGYTFDVFNTDRGLPANDIWELHADNAGRIWFNSFSYEFGFIRNNKYKAIHFKNRSRIFYPNLIANVGDLIAFSMPEKGGMSLCFAGDDLVKVATFRTGVPYFGEQGFYRNITVAERKGISFWANDGKVYGLNRTDSGFKWGFRSEVSDELLHMYTSKAGVSPEGRVNIFKMYGKALYSYNIEDNTLDSLSLQTMGADPSERIYAFNPYFLSNNRSTFTSLITNSHLYSISKDFKWIGRQLITDLLPSTAQLAYRYIDRDGTIWYTTNGDGVWSIAGENGFYSGLVGMPQLKDSRFVGSIGNRQYRWDYKKFLLFEITRNNITRVIELHKNIDIKSITGNDSVAYLNTAESIYKYDVATGNMRDLRSLYKIRSFMFYDETPNTVKENDISMEQIRVVKIIGRDLYGLSGFGVVQYHFEGDEIICRRLDDERYLGIVYDNQRHFRICYSGRRIFLSDLATGRDKVLKEDMLDSLGIGTVQQIEMDRFGNIFMLGDKQIFITDTSFLKLQKIPHTFLVSDARIALSCDRLFIAGKFGLAYLDITAHKGIGGFHIVPNRALSNYRKFEGLQVSTDGYALLKTSEGSFGFHVDSLARHSSGKRDGDLFDVLLVAPTERTVKPGDTIRFLQDVEKLTFGAINFYGAGTVKFIYEIAGEKDRDESSSGDVFLGSLKPGKYYRVVVRLRDDMWESTPRIFYIYRTPYWWQSATWKTIFWMTGVLFFLVLVLAIILITRYFVAKKNERRRAIVELELRAIHSQINPHFIFNTLSASLFFINKKRFDDAYNHVNKFSKLLRSYLKSSQDRYVILEEEIGMLRNYIDLQQIRFEEKFAYVIEVDNKLPLNNIRIPSLLLQPLVENAINHGLFHKGEGGKLLLKFLQGAGSTELICIIDDNGIGRDAAKKINDTNSARESYGTKLTNQLLDVFKQYEHFDIKIEYTDKVLPETGTIVTLTLKNIEYVA